MTQSPRCQQTNGESGSKSGRPIRALAGVLPCLLLAMCATTGGATCDGWKPIRPTKADIAKLSDSAVSQLLSYNEYGRKVCGWKPRR
jgi:hypothetical protein